MNICNYTAEKSAQYSILGVYMHFLGRGGAYINELPVMLKDDTTINIGQRK